MNMTPDSQADRVLDYAEALQLHQLHHAEGKNTDAAMGVIAIAAGLLCAAGIAAAAVHLR